MFHKPKPIKIFVSKAMIYPLKIVLLGIAFYFLLDLYEIFSTGIAHGRYGKVFTVHSDLFNYFGVFSVKLAFTIFFSALAYGVREKKGDEKNENDAE